MKAFFVAALVTFALIFALLWGLGGFDASGPCVPQLPPSAQVVGRKGEIAATPETPSDAAQESPSPFGARERDTGILEFHNAASATLGDGWYGLPDLLPVLSRYPGAWRPSLPAAGERRSSARGRLLPPDGLFPPETAERLGALVAAMDGILDGLLEDWRRLEKCAPDDAAGDEARIAAIEAGRGRYLAARGEYLSIVEGAAVEAEDRILAEHPLRRQFVAARRVFAVFRRATDGFDARNAGNEALRAVSEELKEILAEARTASFAGSPRQETPYRLFLREAARFSGFLERGLAQGYDAAVMRELNASMQGSCAAYGAFAREAGAF